MGCAGAPVRLQAVAAMNLPSEANVALVDFLSASRRYSELMTLLSRIEVEPGHPAMLELEATIRDAEQALLAIFTAVLGEPDVTFPEDERGA